MFKNINLILVALSSYVLSLPVVCNTLMTNEIRVAQAVEGEANVLDELLEVPEFREAYLNGDYDADPTVDDFDVLYAVESGYSASSKYYLYLYVWNKSGNGSDVYNFLNRYNSAEFYSFATYKSFSMDMQFVNRSDDYRFIKYRISDVSEKNFYNSEQDRREYGITGIEIAHIEGNLQKFKDYPIAKKWNFEGDKSDLFVTHNSSFEYLPLDLGSGAFPYSKWDDVYNPHFGGVPLDLNGYVIKRQKNLYYVYFDVPKTYKNSGSLYSIHADYYDFDLSNKIAFLLDEHEQQYYIDNYNIFDNLLKNGETFSTNELLFENRNNYIFHAYFDQYQNARCSPYYLDGDTNTMFHIGHVITPSAITPGGVWCDFGYDFTPEDFINQYKILIPISDVYSDVSGHLISKYFDRLTAERVSGQSSSDVYKEIHYCNPGTGREDSDAIETGWDLISVANSHWAIWNWWHNVSDDINVSELKCIEHIDYSDASLSDDAFKNKYYVNSNDIGSIKERLSEDKDTYLFRFKTAETKTIEVDYVQGSYIPGSFVAEPFAKVGYAAYGYEGVVDFDVLDLTFVNEDDELETIPVVSDPVNVFPDVPSPIRPSTGGCGGFWKTVLMILMVLALVLLVFFFLKWFIPWRRNRQVVNAIKSSGKTANKNGSVNHYTYNIKKTYISKSNHKKRKKRRK